MFGNFLTGDNIIVDDGGPSATEFEDSQGYELFRVDKGVYRNDNTNEVLTSDDPDAP